MDRYPSCQARVSFPDSLLIGKMGLHDTGALQECVRPQTFHQIVTLEARPHLVNVGLGPQLDTLPPPQVSPSALRYVI